MKLCIRIACVAVSFLIAVVSFFSLSAAFVGPQESGSPSGKLGAIAADSVVLPNVQQRVQRASSINMCQTNWGLWGSSGRRWNESKGGCFNPDPDSEVPAPSFEFPKDSGLDYLFVGALWVGAKLEDFPYVSVGWDGWHWNYEMWPDRPAPLGAIEESSRIFESTCYSPTAVSDQDIIAHWTDTLVWETIWDRYPFWNDIDRRWHRPLGVEVIQKTHSWAEPELSNLIIAESLIRNIGEQALTDVYVGLFLDTDICDFERPYGSQACFDDITGFLKRYEVAPGDTQEVSIAWAADNDGWVDCEDGLHWTVRSVIGAKILDVSRADVEFSYNWWISSIAGIPYDWGPWKADNQGIWAQQNCYAVGDSFFPHHALGTPGGDCSKYFIMSNGEIDYDQAYSCTWPSEHPEEGWLGSSEVCDDFADGKDTRFLLSFGPFDPLSPGDSIHFAVAYVMGESFHIDPDNGQNLPANPDSFYAHVYFSDLVHKALVAQWLYDSLSRVPTSVEESERSIPAHFSLSQNYPNPFNPDTKIGYNIAEGHDQPVPVSLTIYNILGQAVRTLVDEPQRTGRYEVVWDGKDHNGNDVASGIYFYQLKLGELSQTKRMALVR